MGRSDEQQDLRDQEKYIMKTQQEEDDNEEEIEGHTQMYPPPIPAHVRPVQFPPPANSEQQQEVTRMPPAHPSEARPVQFPPPGPQQMPARVPIQNQNQNYNQNPNQHQNPNQQAQGLNNGGQAQVIFTNRWKTGLFDCMNDPNNALTTLFFPCITFGQNAEIIDQGLVPCATSALFVLLLPVIYGSSYRTKLRTKYRLVEEAGPDIMIYLLCAPCAICQEYRELQSNGLDPSIGWQGNMQLQQQRMGMKPPPIQQMQG